MKRWAAGALVLSLMSLAACSTSTSDPITDAFKGQSEQQIYTGGTQALAKKNYSSAVKHFEALGALYPFSDDQEQAQLDLIYAYYMDQDYDSSAAAADRFIHLYPRSTHVDYAYYMKGMASFSVNRGFATKFVNLDLAERDLSATKGAFEAFQDLLQLYPDSPYAASARGRMVYLRNLLAAHEVEIANYYFKRKAYVAAINRANKVVQHYQQAPAVVPALGLLVESYQALKLNDQANQTLAILQLNYPDSAVYKQVSKGKMVTVTQKNTGNPT
jgi:outer membrane protein assembly factor BamD